MDMRLLCLTLSVTLLLFLASVTPSNAQAYHFSNGWFPGRKRSADTGYDVPSYRESAKPRSGETAYRSQSSATHACLLRPQVQQLLTDLIQSELLRLVAECQPDVSTERHHTPAMSALRAQDIASWIQSMRDDRNAEDSLKDMEV